MFALKLARAQLLQIGQTLQWIYTKNTIERWLISAVRIGAIKLYGPQNKLANLTAEEFMYCEASYERWLQTTQTSHLDLLFTVLFRRKYFFNTFRASFDAQKLPKAQIRAAKLKSYVKKAVAMNYAGIRNLIIDRHPNVWKKATEGETSGSGGTTNWAGIILDLSGDKFGTYEQTIKTNIWLVLADLDKKAKQAAEMEGKSK
jgi:hypothetical protein